MPKSISSRPSVEQVSCMLEFMEEHPQLGLGKLKGVYGAAESKKLWLLLTRQLNACNGPNRPVKSWMKFWADKKSMVKSKVSQGSDPSVLTSNVERKIWDGFIAGEMRHQERSTRRSKRAEHLENQAIDSDEIGRIDIENIMEPVTDFEERQMVITKNIVRVMDGQATALTELANSSAATARAMNRLADAAQIQALALQGLASALAASVVRCPADPSAMLKRLYATGPA